ncbi:bacteriohemerythrin [Methylomonas rivi]|uniref:Hemerythrin family protein n=1 Tax=Methylomonas rivi TaxID=2952226 RepID=A0ABT1U2D5_9GAMM|nr:hemerythrin family protein [Methylomonas sp. WSC-6]MCQ8127610.1 hemerythrin family protein [Methylomonas sp. WSC-6]
MSKFIWRDEYKTGHDTIDAQHRNLFKLANQLVDVSDQDEITRLLMLFFQHVREHFQYEEQFMKQSGYSDYQAHVESHNKMLDKLIDISKKVQLKQWIASEIQSFVDSWVLVHILGEDLKFIDELKAKKVSPG